MGEYADEYEWLLDALGDRRVVIVDVRGRGRSDVPETGYRWEDHIGDLRAAVEQLGIIRPVVVAFSRGSSYALGYALAVPDRAAGTGDRRLLRPPRRAPGRVRRAAARHRIRGVLIADRMSEHAVRQVFAESREVPLWERLTEIPCPVLVIRGGRKGALVDDELAAQWQASLPTVELAMLADAGHDLWSRDVDAYLAVLLPFVERVGAV